MRTRMCLGLLLGAMLPYSFASQAFAADPPSPKLALSFRPVQPDVDYEIPDPSTYDQCKVKVERQGKSSGWVVLGPAGQTLRRYVDTNGDNVVDQWQYFQRGLEVYRDSDANFNNKVDQCRWLNTGGTRWGIDSNEDGKIDRWKSISAEEASREAIRALVSGNDQILRPLLITRDDLTSLGIKGDLAKKLIDNVASPDENVRKALKGAKSMNSKTRWMRFDSLQPSLIPSEQLDTKSDLMVYQNVMAIVETDTTPGLVQIGEMIRVDDVWKLTRIPQPVEGDSIQIAEGLLLQPQFTSDDPAPSIGTAEIDSEMQKLIEQLQELDKNSPSPSASRTVLARYNSQRMDLMEKLFKAAKTPEDEEQWTRQMADSITSAIQTGSAPDGTQRLDKLLTDLKKKSPKSPVVSYVAYRKLLAGYTVSLQDADNEKRNEVQEKWLKDLEKFVDDYPKADDSAEAMLQLAITQEFNGNSKEATSWYKKLASNHGESVAGQRAAGALRRFDLKGNKIDLKGQGLDGSPIDVTSLKNQVVLVLYWATWCKPCTEDLPQVRALYEQYHKAGFEIIGVNLDTIQEEVAPYLKTNQVTWPQIYESGGLESPPARQYGIISLPTMILVDQSGTVINRNINVAELKSTLAELLETK